jgi:autotransporter-associated beta strand protein
LQRDSPEWLYIGLIQQMFEKVAARGLLAAAWVTSVVTMQVASAQSDPVGYQALLTSFSAAGLPAPGTGVVIEQVEGSVSQTSDNYYMPDATQPQLHGVSITDENGGGAVSWHATNVADVFYGTYGFGSGISQVDVYEADSWLANVLNVGLPIGPTSAPANDPAVANFSWIDSKGTPYDNDALRRLDYLINRDQLVAVVAVNNNNGAVTPIPPLLASSYNSIAVGLSNAESSLGPVPTGDVDGPGRSKPDIVAPQNETSYATPEVSAAAAMLVQVARSNPAYSLANNNAAVIKAILMAGTDKNPLSSWSRTPTQPLDPQYGAGQLNFNWAYQILTAGPQTASSKSLVGSTGWIYDSPKPTTDAKTYYFQVPGGQPFDLSALLTWERNVAYTPGSGTVSATFTPSLATIDLALYRANSNLTLGSLLDDSISTVDNVQYVFDRGLTSGEYALQVTRVNALSGPWNYALAWQLQDVPHWTAAVNGSWNDPTKWTNDLVPSGVGREADLDAPSTVRLSVTLDVPQTIGQLTLGNTASSGAGYTISTGSPGTLTFNNGGSSSQLTVMSGSHVVDAPVILAGNLQESGSGTLAFGNSSSITDNGGGYSLTMNGAAGTLILGGSDTYRGGTNVNAGTLVVTSNDALADGTSLTVGAGGTLIFDPSITSAPMDGSTFAASTISPVPEPGTLVLLAAAGLAAFAARRRSRT